MRKITEEESKKYGCNYCLDKKKIRLYKKCPYDSCPYAKYIEPYGNYSNFAKSPNAFFDACKQMNKEEKEKNGKG